MRQFVMLNCCVNRTNFKRLCAIAIEFCAFAREVCFERRNKRPAAKPCQKPRRMDSPRSGNPSTFPGRADQRTKIPATLFAWPIIVDGALPEEPISSRLLRTGDAGSSPMIWHAVACEKRSASYVPVGHFAWTPFHQILPRFSLKRATRYAIM